MHSWKSIPIYLSSILVFGFLSLISAQTIDQKVQMLLDKMTLEEKAGQMTQISLEYVCKGYPATADPLELDMVQLAKMVKDMHVGSLLNVGSYAHPVEKWDYLITSIQNMALNETRLGIPIIYGIDAIHGAGYIKDATLFPQSISMAATFNPSLVKKSAQITAVEMRAAGIPWNFNPVLGVGRHPLWSRLWETFGEDPYLVGVMGKAYVEGQEGRNVADSNQVAACMKHYLGYSYPRTGTDRTPAWIPDRQLREIFVPPFQAAVDAGVHSVMVNSSEINGIPVHTSAYYLKELLINEMGFEGFVVSDWLDIKNLYTREKVASSEKEATKMAVMAGIDMSMVPTDTSFTHYLIELVQEGEVPMSRIDEAVSRILKVKFQLGLFENPYPVELMKKQFACDEFKAINLQAARECMTLVKNENGTLPLKQGTRLLVTGPTADKLSLLNGGWTITWQGDREDLYNPERQTIKEALTAAFGTDNVTYSEGCTYDKPVNVEETVKAAELADVIVACLGEHTYCEGPGNIHDLTLPKTQLDFIKALKATGKPLIMIMIEGRPRIIRDIVDDADAILIAFLPGEQGGIAIAEVLSGKINPSGKLPVSYPKNPNNLTLYDHRNSEIQAYKPQWPFGYGLGYTTFETSNLQLDKQTVQIGEPVTVIVDVTNTGSRAGQEVVQLYLQDEVASVTPAVRRLKGFKKIRIQPGETQTVTFIIDKQAMSFINRDNKWTVEPGQFRVMVGNQSERFEVLQ